MKERVTLRYPEPYDIEAMSRWDNVSPDEMQAFVYGYDPDIRKSGQLRLVIADTETDAPLGCIDLFEYDEDARSAKVGYYVDEAVRRKGIATEAIGLLLDEWLPRLGIENAIVEVGKDNIASLRLARKCGFKVSEADPLKEIHTLLL